MKKILFFSALLFLNNNLLFAQTNDSENADTDTFGTSKNFLTEKTTAPEFNYFAGNQAGHGNTGWDNTGVGEYAMSQSNSGRDNSGFGYFSLSYNSTGNNNTAVGASGLTLNKTGSDNSGFGYKCLYSNNSGSRNTATGSLALYSNTASYNTANGYKSLYSNISGTYNTAIGGTSLYSNTASYNTAAGYAALYANTSGFNNSAIGYKSLGKNITGSDNTAIGYQSLYSNIDGYKNTALGDSALYANISGYKNTATGGKALNANKFGYYNTATGYDALLANTNGNLNTATGTGALYNNTNGKSNCAQGFASIYFNTVGSNNCAFGNSTLYYNTGSYNTAVGSSALSSNKTGSNNTAIGSNANTNGSSYSNITLLGSGVTGTASNQVRIGNSVVNSIGGYVDWTVISDLRVNGNIKTNVPGLAFINKLKPFTYNLDLQAADIILQRPVVKDKDGELISQANEESAEKQKKQAVVYSGFAAQEVEKAAKEIGYDFNGIDAAKNDKDLYGLRYAEFVVPLVKAVQELSLQNDELKKEVRELKAMIISNQSSVNNQRSTVLASAFLQQNMPNPFTNSTTINYTLPKTHSSAKIIITDRNGKIIKEANISGNGQGSLKVDASALAGGVYQYSLYVNDKLIDSRQMVLTK